MTIKQKRRLRKSLKRKRKDRLKTGFRNIFVKAGVLNG